MYGFSIGKPITILIIYDKDPNFKLNGHSAVLYMVFMIFSGEPCSQLLGSRPGCCNGGMLSLSDQDTENQPLDLSAHTPSPAMLTCGQRSPPPDVPSPKSAIELKVPHIVKSG